MYFYRLFSVTVYILFDYVYLISVYSPKQDIISAQWIIEGGKFNSHGNVKGMTSKIWWYLVSQLAQFVEFFTLIFPISITVSVRLKSSWTFHYSIPPALLQRMCKVIRQLGTVWIWEVLRRKKELMKNSQVSRRVLAGDWSQNMILCQNIWTTSSPHFSDVTMRNCSD